VFYRLVGDIHGHFRRYLEIIQDAERSIQVGDFGVGFLGHEDFDAGVAEWQKANPNHRFARGNHDNPEVCKNMPGWIPDGTVLDNVMVIGGAHSVEWDRVRRTPYVDWWPEEELSWEAFDHIRAVYMAVKPDVLITHDFPEECARSMFGFYTDRNQSRQRAMLQELFDIRRPDLIVGGHWHEPRDMEVRGVRCICLNINQHIDIDL